MFGLCGWSFHTHALLCKVHRRTFDRVGHRFDVYFGHGNRLMFQKFRKLINFNENFVVFPPDCHIMELAERYPNSGSFYTFTYATFGELPAFLIGWSSLLDHAAYNALVAKSLSAYLEFLFSAQVRLMTTHVEMQRNTTTQHYGHQSISIFADQFDPLCFGGIVLSTLLAAVSTKVFNYLLLTQNILFQMIFYKVFRFLP